jgi:hypothetical protein
MGWSIGYDSNWKRDIGYGVPAYCDAPSCGEEIDRGLAYVCGGEPYGEPHGCGLFFCAKHLFHSMRKPQRCNRCFYRKPPYKQISAEHPRWLIHKLTDESWQQWRDKNPEEVAAILAECETRNIQIGSGNLSAMEPAVTTRRSETHK